MCYIVFASPLPAVGGGAGADQGARPLSSGVGLPAGSPSPEAALRRFMAALGRRWSARVFLALRPLHDAAPPRDVLLFQHERGRFFVVLGLFCAGQGVFWASLAVAALARPPARALPPDAEPADRGRLDLRSALWRYGLAVGCGAIGKAWAGLPPRGRGAAGHDPPCPGKDSAGLPTWRPPSQALRQAWGTASLSSYTARDPFPCP